MSHEGRSSPVCCPRGCSELEQHLQMFSWFTAGMALFCWNTWVVQGGYPCSVFQQLEEKGMCCCSSVYAVEADGRSRKDRKENQRDQTSSGGFPLIVHVYTQPKQNGLDTLGQKGRIQHVWLVHVVYAEQMKYNNS